MSYKSNANEVVNKLNTAFGKIAGEAGIKKVGQIASTIASNNVRRIHNEGRALDGSLINSKIIVKNKQGAYSKSYAKKRIEKGRQISKVDLSFTGDLSKSFLPQRNGKKFNIGFIRNAELADNLEEKYNQEIWGVTENDKKLIKQEFQNFIKQIVKTK